MNSFDKELYEAPIVSVVVVKTEGMICSSSEANATMSGVFGEETI